MPTQPSLLEPAPAFTPTPLQRDLVRHVIALTRKAWDSTHTLAQELGLSRGVPPDEFNELARAVEAMGGQDLPDEAIDECLVEWRKL